MYSSARLLMASAALVLRASALYASAPEATAHGEGQVVAVDRSRGWIMVEHGAIGKLFVAGRTEFPVEPADLLAGLLVGDRVAFELTTPPDGHGALLIADIQVLGREPSDTRGAGITRHGVGLVALVTLLAAILGCLGLQARRFRHLIEGNDAMVASGREQVRLQREMMADVQTVAAALLPVLRDCQSDLRRLSERVALEAARNESGEPQDTARPVLVVRRGETEVFRTLDDRLGKPGLARVVWDRRREQERRSMVRPPTIERRRGERRGPLPVTWQGLGYLVVQPKARHLNVVA